jgi:hypothetical protein
VSARWSVVVAAADRLEFLLEARSMYEPLLASTSVLKDDAVLARRELIPAVCAQPRR